MIEIRETLYWEHLGIAGALAVSLMVLLGLLLRVFETSGARMHLWAMIGFFAVNAIDATDSLVFILSVIELPSFDELTSCVKTVQLGS